MVIYDPIQWIKALIKKVTYIRAIKQLYKRGLLSYEDHKYLINELKK